jgi:hypothetical protein
MSPMPALIAVSIVLYLETIVYLFFTANLVVSVAHKLINSFSTPLIMVDADDIKR